MSRALKIKYVEKVNTNPYEGRFGLVYARVSGKKQELEGHGREAQEERCKKDLASTGVPYEKSFIDTYTGGGDFMNRPAMRDMLAYIDAHPHKKFVAVFDDLKRFARDTVFHIKLRSALKGRDVTPRCLNYNFDDSPEGMFVETILAAGNELERHQNRRQVIQKQKARLEAGYWPFGSRKGYKIVKDPMHGKISVPDAFEAPLLKEAIEGFATGIYLTKLAACKFLREKGFWSTQPAQRYTDKFTAILKDSFYAGYSEYPPWEVERRLGKHNGIISLETFELVQRRLARQDTGKKIRLDINPEFPLRGLISCAECKSRLTAAPSKGRPKSYGYYVCHNTKCSMRGKSLRKKDVEDGFDVLLKKQVIKGNVDALIKAVFDDAWRFDFSEIKKAQLTLEQSKNGLKQRIKEITELVIKAKSPEMAEIYEGQLEETGRELKELEGVSLSSEDLSIPYRTALDKATGLLKSPYKIWVTLDAVEKQKLFYFIFEERLAYSKKDGYRTDEIPCAVRLFEEFATANTMDVIRTPFSRHFRNPQPTLFQIETKDVF